MSQGENLAIETCEGLQLCNLEALASVERVEAHEIARRVVASEINQPTQGRPTAYQFRFAKLMLRSG